MVSEDIYSQICQAVTGMGYRQLSAVQIALISFVELLALMLSIYHPSHEGKT